MKKIILLAMVCLYANIASAQVLIALLLGDKLNSEKIEFGFNVMPTLSTLTQTDGDFKSGLGLGLYFNIRLKPNLYFHPEFSPKTAFGTANLAPYATGYNNIDQIYLNDAQAGVLKKIKAMSLPLLIRYRIKGLLFANLGPQINVFYKPKDIFTTEADGNEIDYTTSIKNQVSFMDIGLAGGLEYKLKKDKGMGIGLRYYYGLTDVLTKLSGSQRNSAFNLSVFIPIDPGAKKK
ncbi:outer membrane beta-barrel protein [Pedobacter endophyticus]|uniref:Outer membrane beta-barrel protein n=1 Tax=Pedobacter endophyticus TaxID=2789740 RepID=A0A7S9PYY0_9SPHI|nr:outer membrane beta-barrel protein [Pedobacter endophyticus]QPH39350.1 outer membrane beta-barrel protein [Pedobacter endophyticus]